MKPDPFVSIQLNGIKLQVIIGTLPHEREVLQEIMVNIAFTYDASLPAVTDVLSDAVDYAHMHRRIITAVAGTRFQLLERLGAFILDLIMQEAGIISATILLEKARVLPGVLSVGVRMSAGKSFLEAPVIGRSY
ncbi:MAG: dihydroneopterin aldolase [Candidatus Omnitrophota bacterium]